MILKVDNINVFYGNIHALRDVSLEVNEGEIVALIGANGCGKSTTLKTISGLLRSVTGSISFLEQDISKEYPHKLVSRGLAHVPEGRHIFQQLSVLANLELGAYTCGRVSSKDLENVYTHFPAFKGASESDCRDTFGRRTADAGNRARYDESSEADNA